MSEPETPPMADVQSQANREALFAALACHRENEMVISRGAERLATAKRNLQACKQAQHEIQPLLDAQESSVAAARACMSAVTRKQLDEVRKLR